MAKAKTHKKLILSYLASGMNVSEACGQCGVSRSSFYRWIKLDPDFEAKVEKVTDDYHAKLIESFKILYTKARQSEALRRDQG